jgi:hypothetical protein
MRERIDKNSGAEGYTTSRLPKFSAEEVEYIRGRYILEPISLYSFKTITLMETIHTHTHTIIFA